MKRKCEKGFIITWIVFFCLSIPSITLASTDTVKPKIYGTANKTVFIGTSFNAKTGVSARDNIDGDLTKNIKVSGTVNMKKAGRYRLTYSVVDKAKNKATSPRTITVVKDTVKPVISGISNKTVYLGSSFNALSGVTAKDNVDGNITKKIKLSGTVNLKKPGKYKLTYSVADKAKNNAAATRIITVIKDTINPKISGVSNKTIYIGSAFNSMSGVSAIDKADGNLTKNIKISGTVNSKKAGNYQLTYTVSDKAKNTTSSKRTITVKDNIKPLISGAKDIEINFGDDFNALNGVSATDNNDGNISSAIKVIGSVNVNKTGVYVLTYTVADQSGNSVSVRRTVTVIDKISPVLTGIEDMEIYFGHEFNPLEGIYASDNNDGDITSSIKVDGSVNVNKAGSYILTYSIADQSGNTVSEIRAITVIDHISPVISHADDTTVGLYTQFNLLNGVSAFDNNDGDITSKIEISGSVDTNIEGQYVVTYKVTDAAGNSKVIIRTITVQKIAVNHVSIIAPETIKTGKTQRLTATISPTNATDQQIIWRSSSESVATIDEHGVLKTLAEGTTTITATVDGVSTSKTLTVSDRPNLYFYKSGSATINNVIKSLSISIYNLEDEEIVHIEKVEVFENSSLFTVFSAEKLKDSGINTTINPQSSWGMSITFKIGVWANQSNVVVTVKNKNGTLYQYTLNI